MYVTDTDLLVVILVLLAVVSLVYFFVLPLVRIEIRRRAARRHAPQPEEIWVQDGELLYIDATTPSGVEIIHWDAQGKTMNRWKDSWEEWQQRLRSREVWYTGQRKPLGGG